MPDSPLTYPDIVALIALLDASPADCSDGILPRVKLDFDGNNPEVLILGPGGTAHLLDSGSIELPGTNLDKLQELLDEAIARFHARAKNIQQIADPFAGGAPAALRFAIATAAARQPELVTLAPRNEPLDFVAKPGASYRLPRLCPACMSLPASYDCPVCQTAGTIELGVPQPAAPDEPAPIIQLPRLCPHGTFDATTCPPCQRDAARAAAGAPPIPARGNG